MQIVAAFDTDPHAVTAYRTFAFKGAKVATPKNWRGMVKLNQAEVVLARQPDGAYGESPTREDMLPSISLVIECVRPRHFLIRVEDDLFLPGRPGSAWIGWWSKAGYRMTATPVDERAFEDKRSKRWLLLTGTRKGCPFVANVSAPQAMSVTEPNTWPESVPVSHKRRLVNDSDSPVYGAILGEKIRRLDPQSTKVIDLMGGCGMFSSAFCDDGVFRDRQEHNLLRQGN